MSAATSELLAADGLDAGYGKSQVLFGMSLAVQPGRCTTLLGRNGMGKSTTIKTMMGLVRPMRGEVRWKGRPIQGRAAHVVARLGVGLVPEGRQVFPNLTVHENLVATAVRRSKLASPWTLGRVHRLFPRLAERSRNYGNQLSGGEQQMLAIGRALLTNPELLILDEATEGLSPLIRQEIWSALHQIKSEGMAILLVDKNLAPLLGLADRHYIVEKGAVAWTGSSDELRAAKSVQQRYLSAAGSGGQGCEPAVGVALAPGAAEAEQEDERAAGMTLLESLYLEHRSIASVLNGMAQMIDGTPADGAAAVIPALHAMLYYFDVFPERHHHPKEEEYLFPAIRERTRELDTVLERLQRQHLRGDEALRELQQRLLRAQFGGTAEWPGFVDAARVFIGHYRDHLRVEEEDLMPVARRVVPREVWARIEQQFRTRPDPLQLGTGEAGAAALVHRILELAPAPLGFGGAR